MEIDDSWECATVVAVLACRTQLSALRKRLQDPADKRLSHSQRVEGCKLVDELTSKLHRLGMFGDTSGNFSEMSRRTRHRTHRDTEGHPISECKQRGCDVED